MIGEDIYIIDDIIPLSKQTEIEDLFTYSTMPWIFNRDISLTQQEIKKLGITKLTPGIGTPIKDYQSKYVNSEILDKIKIIPEQACIGMEVQNELDDGYGDFPAGARAALRNVAYSLRSKGRR